MKALVKRGFVRAGRLGKSGSKVGYLYVLTPKGATETTSMATAFLGRKLEEYEMLRQEIEALRCEVEPSSLADLGRGTKL